MIELSRYAFESLRTDPEFILYRAHRSSFAKASQDRSEDESEDKDPSSVLVLAPALEQPELGTLKRLEHECSLRDELDAEWTVRPIELTHHWGRSVLVLENPGGVPLESACGRFGLGLPERMGVRAMG